MLASMEDKGPAVCALEDIEERATRLVRDAGRMVLERFWRPFHVEYKRGDRSDPVTEADRDVEAFLRSSIAREFPEHGILGEEGTEVDAGEREFLWALDPVDGTTNFVNGLPLFSCSAALLRRGEPVVGAVFLSIAPRALTRETESPEREARRRPYARVDVGSAVLHARLGGGAFLDGEPVRASEATTPEPSSLAGLPGHHLRQFRRLNRLRENPGEPRCLGSVCYEMGLVACGVLRYAVFRRPKLWDVAAGALIVRESGGLSLQWRESRWEPLRRFEPMRNPRKPEERGLRHWSAVTLVGGSQVAGFVAERLRPSCGMRARIAALLAQLGGPW